MTLPTPALDGRDRDGMMLDAVTAVRTKAPEWSGSSPGDAGSALLEACTDMALALADRVNRAPDQHRLAMLRLLGAHPDQASPAGAYVVFQLTAPTAEEVRIPAGIEVATQAPEGEPVVFSTVADVLLRPVDLLLAGWFEGWQEQGTFTGTMAALPTGGTSFTGGRPEPSARLAGPWGSGTAYVEPWPEAARLAPDGPPYLPACFPGAGGTQGLPRWRRDAGQPGVPTERYPLVVLAAPAPGAWLTFGVTVPKPTGRDAGHEGTAPGEVHWEVWQGTHWIECQVLGDGTAGLTRDGRVTVALPLTQAETAVVLSSPPERSGHSEEFSGVGLLRVRSAAPKPGPLASLVLNPIMSVLVPVIQAQLVQDELLGTARGRSGERFRFAHPPVIRAGSLAVDAVHPDGTTERWNHVDSLAGSGPDDRHFALDARTGEAVFAAQGQDTVGPRRFGALLPPGARLRVPHYFTGGGGDGNVPAGAITVMHTPLPYVAGVVNLAPATGGRAVESMTAYARRAPLGSTVPERAVVPGDYERIALGSAAGMARAHHLPRDPGDVLDPAHNYTQWEPTEVKVVFTVAAGTDEVSAGSQVRTADSPPVVFTTTDTARRASPATTTVTPLRLKDRPSDPQDMFERRTPNTAGVLTGSDTVGGDVDHDIGLVLAAVAVPVGTRATSLTLWVRRDPAFPGARLPLSVYCADTERLWWDIENCFYTGAAAEKATLGGEAVDAHAVRLSDAAAWRDVLDTTGEPPSVAPPELVLQIQDPERQDDTRYTVFVDTGQTGEVPAEQSVAGSVTDTRTSTGAPGQSYILLDAPVRGDRLPQVAVDGEPWTTVKDFRNSGPNDKHTVVNASTGRVHFGPEVPYSDPRQHGMIPPQGATISVQGSYTVTRGRIDVPTGTVTRLVPPASAGAVAVYNRGPATGGQSGYTDVSGGTTQLGVRLLVVPAITPDARGWFPYPLLTPSQEAVDALLAALAARMPPDVPVWVEPPRYLGVHVTADIVPQAPLTGAEREALRVAAERALYRCFSPVDGGPQGTGWPLGRAVRLGEAYRVLVDLPGVERVPEVRLRPADPRTGDIGAPVDTLVCDADQCVYSVGHDVRVTGPGEWRKAGGA
ncbi:baseplate J/gp47 family protein [Kitasatospora sp. NPDC056327]|uniref:baseplate J/gp47 family protein n=1 Tax=Kitasatospora sp. NPDC056327 TaxID=3345785 RepID=UPI0035DDE60C